MLIKLKEKNDIEWNISDIELKNLGKQLKNYSGSDIKNFFKEASMMPMRKIHPSKIKTVNKSEILPVVISDF